MGQGAIYIGKLTSIFCNNSKNLFRIPRAQSPIIGAIKGGVVCNLNITKTRSTSNSLVRSPEIMF